MELVKEQQLQKKEAPLLESYRIKSTDSINANVYLAKIGNTNKFSRGNISAWTGAAKSKKTFAMTMLIGSMLKGGDLYGKFNSYNKNKVIWIDTEQSPYDVQKVAKRLSKISNNDDDLYMYALRPLSPKQRIEKIKEALKQVKCDVLVIDGIRDLIMNINNPEESTEIVTLLMKWSYDYDIHISTVIHQSMAGKARGHIGTEVENKSETVIKVIKDEFDKDTSKIQEVYGRGKGFNDFSFFIDQDGLPVVGGPEVSDLITNDDAPY